MEVKGYIDVPRQIAGVDIAHPLLVVSRLSFQILIGMEVLRPYSAEMLLGESVPFQLNTRICDICIERRTDLDRNFWSAPSTVCTTVPISIQPRTATIVQVRVPRSLQKAATVVVDPLGSAIIKFGCATLPAVCAPIDGICRVAVMNPSNKPIQIGADTSIAAINSVEQTLNNTQIAATAPRLSYQGKLRKVLFELTVDTLDDSVPHKQKLVLLISNYLDIFAENDSDVGSTNLTIHEIDTSEVRPFRQPVHQLPYGEMRAAVESEIIKLVNAEIARPSKSPWASPVDMV